MIIGEKISYMRKELGLTQEELCKGICSITYLSKVENNKLTAKKYILELLCDRLNISIEELMSDDFEKDMNQIRHLYKIISNRFVKNAENILSQLNELSKSNNPIILSATHISALEFYILKKDKAKSSSIKRMISKMEKYLNNEISIWYFKALGHYEYIFGDIKKSSDFFYKAKKIIDSTQDKDAHIEYLLGLANTRLMEVAKSILHTEKALEIYNREIDFKKIIDCKLLLGINYSKLGYYHIAEEYFLKIAKELEDSEENRLLGKVYHNLGYLYSLNDNNSALDFLRKALNLKLNAVEKLNTLYLLAYEYKKRGVISETQNICEHGMQIAEPENLHYYYKFFILKQSLKPNGFNEEGFLEKLENQVLPYFLKDDPTVAKDCYFLIADVLFGENKYKGAALYFKKAINLQFKGKRKELLF